MVFSALAIKIPPDLKNLLIRYPAITFIFNVSLKDSESFLSFEILYVKVPEQLTFIVTGP